MTYILPTSSESKNVLNRKTASFSTPKKNKYNEKNQQHSLQQRRVDHNLYGTASSAIDENLLVPQFLFMQRSLCLLLLIVFLIQIVGYYRHVNNTKRKRENYLPLQGCTNNNNCNFLPKRQQQLKTESPSQNNYLSRPSPKHPALERVPSFLIRLETMKVLRVVGIRVIAHGIHSQSRRIWISIDDQSLIWHSEYKTKLPNNAGDSSLLAIRGPSHRIDWEAIKYIDIGKHTDALKQLSPSIGGRLCFSILTEHGSLDLQAKSRLERDALVSCLCNMLDEYNNSEKWRDTHLGSSSIGVKTSTIVSGLSTNDRISSSSSSGSSIFNAFILDSDTSNNRTS